MKCKKCGAELKEGTDYCSYCGEKNAFSLKAIPKKIRAFMQGLSVFGKISAIGILVSLLFLLIALFSGRFFSANVALLQGGGFLVSLLIQKNIIKRAPKWIKIVIPIVCITMTFSYLSGFAVGQNDIYSDEENIVWSDLFLSDKLPEPPSTYGKININDDDILDVDINNISEEQFIDYIKLCKENGFNIESEISDTSFFAYSDSGYELTLIHLTNNEKMNIHLRALEKLGALIWPDSGLANIIPTPNSTVGDIIQNDENVFEVKIGSMPHQSFNEYILSCSDSGFNVDAVTNIKSYSAKNADGYVLYAEYIGNGVIHITVKQPMYKVMLKVECVENLIFSTYDVNVYADDLLKGEIAHGASEELELTLYKGVHTIKFENTEDDKVNGIINVDVSRDGILEVKIECTSSKINTDIINNSITEIALDLKASSSAVSIEAGNTLNTESFSSSESINNYEKLKFISENEEIAKVKFQKIENENTLFITIEAITIGETNIYVQADDGTVQSDTMKITVTEPQLQEESTANDTTEVTTAPPETEAPVTTAPPETEAPADNSRTVYVTPTGEKYHYSADCAGKNARATTEDSVKQSYQPCKKCAQ